MIPYNAPNFSEKKLLSTFLHAHQAKVPIWLMRQAGRYLPEYKILRAKTGSFWQCCFTPSIAAEITLQPLKRFPLDAAIIFSDILVIPHAYGVKVLFDEQNGPILNFNQQANLSLLRYDPAILEPVYQAITLVKSSLPKTTSLIGFAGAPWTLAAYMLEGKSTNLFDKAKLWGDQHPKEMQQLLGLLEAAIVSHCVAQIDAGCEVIQLFDSWAGILSTDQMLHWSLEPLKRIVRNIKQLRPGIPILVFPRGVEGFYGLYASHVGMDGLSIGYETSLSAVAKEVSIPLQGNLDPNLLAEDLDQVLVQAKILLDLMKNRPYIFNLGHGVLPHTPIEHVAALVEFVTEYQA